MKQAITKTINTNYSKIYFIDSESFIPFFLNYSEYIPLNKNESPASSLVWDNNQFFTGMQTENKYYLGHMEWSPLLKNIPLNSVFVVPEIELIRLKLSIEDYNKNNTNSISLNQTDEVEQIYSNQEKIYSVTLNFNK
jgi:hypothetical protein